MLIGKLMGQTGDMLFFNVIVHCGTLLAVCVVMKKEIWAILKNPIQPITGMLVVATIPAVLVGLLLGDFVEGSFAGTYLAFGFLLTSVLLSGGELLADRADKPRLAVSWRDSIFMGIMQAVAVMPGVSRSGATISAGLAGKLERNEAAKFAFLMSIPVILGSLVMEVLKIGKTGIGEIQIVPSALGFIFAAVSGFIAITFMLTLIQKHRLFGFAIYTLILGALVLADQIFFHLIF